MWPHQRIYTLLKVRATLLKRRIGDNPGRCRTPTGSPASTPPSSPSRTPARTCTSAPCLLFEGEAPGYDEFVAQHRARACTSSRATARSSRSRRSAQARPVWVDDPHFNAGYHVRHTALPAPAGDEQLRSLAGRVFSQQLDRDKPLWEIWLVDRRRRRPLRADLARPTTRWSTAISGVDITTVLFDLEPDPPERRAAAAVVPAAASRARADAARPTRWPSARARRSAPCGRGDAVAHPERGGRRRRAARRRPRRDGRARALRARRRAR